MSAHPTLFDLGLQLERTELAWRRTALCLVVVGAVSARLLLDASIVAAVLAGTAGGLGGLTLWVTSRRAYRRRRAALLTPAVSRLPGGGLQHALLAVVAGGTGVGVLVGLAVAAGSGTITL